MQGWRTLHAPKELRCLAGAQTGATTPRTCSNFAKSLEPCCFLDSSWRTFFMAFTRAITSLVERRQVVCACVCTYSAIIDQRSPAKPGGYTLLAAFVNTTCSSSVHCSGASSLARSTCCLHSLTRSAHSFLVRPGTSSAILSHLLGSVFGTERIAPSRRRCSSSVHGFGPSSSPM